MKRRVTTDIHIYKITNRINGKVYIGQTYRNVHTRFMEHMIDPESGVYADVCKYGRAVFTYDLLHTCLPQYADQWEHYYICKYNATNPMFGYNRTPNVAFKWVSGGANPSKTEVGKQRISQFNVEHIDQITRGFREYNNSRKFPIGMLNDSGEIIMTFESLNAACRYLNKPPCGSTRIKNVCDTFRRNGKRYKFYGYAWTALNENVQTNSIAECKAKDELPLELCESISRLIRDSRGSIEKLNSGPSAADLTKMAMLRLESDPEWQEIGGRLILPVHDELIVEVPFENREKGAEILKRSMEQAGGFLPFPISCDIEMTFRWYGLEVDDILSYEQPKSMDFDTMSESNIKWVQSRLFEQGYVMPVYKNEDGSKPIGVAAKGINGKMSDELKAAYESYMQKYNLTSGERFIHHIDTLVTTGVAEYE